MERGDELIQVCEYDERWAEAFRLEAAALRSLLGRDIYALEHFGSTSVVGLAAKPIIDILIGVADEQDKGLRSQIVSCGYEWLGELGVIGRQAFRKRGLVNFNIALVPHDSALWADNVAVRDYLRAHPNVAAEYAAAKREAVRNHPTLFAYSHHKNQFMTKLVLAARTWKAHNHSTSSDLDARFTVLNDGPITLQALTLADAQEHLDGEDDELNRWLSEGPSTIDDVTCWIERNRRSWMISGPIRNFGIWETATSSLVGNIEANLDWPNLDGLVEGDANISYGLSPWGRGRGYATVSVRLVCRYLADIGVQRAVIRALPENVNSHRVAERAGFVRDGDLRTRDGQHMLRWVLDLHSAGRKR